MPAKKLNIWNERMLELMAVAIQKGIVRNQGAWCEKIGLRQANLIHVRSGSRGFTIEQILAAANLMGKPMDWFFDRHIEQSGIQLIAEGLRLLEMREAAGAKKLAKAKTVK